MAVSHEANGARLANPSHSPVTYDDDSFRRDSYDDSSESKYLSRRSGAGMFEQELELEKKSSWGPLILVVGLVGLIVGVIGYYVFEWQKGISQAEATTVIEAQLKAKTSILEFRSGKVQAGAEQPKDPHYKVLEKAGLVTLKNVSWDTNIVTVTDAGEKLFASIPGFEKKNNPDNTVSYLVPLATRKLLKIDSAKISNPTSAKVEYEWQWEPNQVGNLFDLNGDNLKSFSTWDHQKLIDKYGADFYHAGAKKEALDLTKGDKGWQINTGY